MGEPESGFVYCEGNPHRGSGASSSVAPIFTPARVVDRSALAGLAFLRRPIPTIKAPQTFGQPFGGSGGGNRVDGFDVNPKPQASAFRGELPPSGGNGKGSNENNNSTASRPTSTTQKPPEASRLKRKSLAPLIENEPSFVRGENRCASPPARSLVVDEFDDDLFIDIDVDALVKQRQSSLPPMAQGAAPQSAPANQTAAPNAQTAPASIASAPPLDGSGLDWRCEHGTSLRQCSQLTQHLTQLREVLIDIEFHLSDEDVVMSNKERKVLEQQRKEGEEIVSYANGGMNPSGMHTSGAPPSGAPHGQQTHNTLAYQTQAINNSTYQAPNTMIGMNGNMSFPPNGGEFGGGFDGDRFVGGDRFENSGGGPFEKNNLPFNANFNDTSERVYNDRPAPGDAAASIPDVECQFVDNAIKMWNTETFPWSQSLRGELKNTFNARDFRGMQLATINCTLSGNDCLVLMPTGGGKSLCYQLPALIGDGLTVVVSPLVSLIQDQLHHLHEMNIPAAVLGSAETEGQQQQNETYDKLYRTPAPELKLLYLTPEKVARSGKLMSALERLHGRGMLSRIVIDEVHCISSWGHDFRKDYKALRILKNKFPDVPVIGLTATATKRVQDDCVRQLGLRECTRFFQSFNRTNIMYDVRHKGKNVVDDMLTEIAERHVGRQGRVSSGIVYCFSQKDCETIAEKLNSLMARDKRRFKKPPGSRELFALPYHAGIDATEKESNQQKWSDGKVPIICATVAFGMGINKPDVRFVFHHSIPKSLEAYHQESGRAGRDGAHSHCTLFYSYGDAQKAKAMLTDSAKKDGAPRAQLESNISALHSLVGYCENVSVCRRTLLLGHFNETFDEKMCKGKCDVCVEKNGGAMFETRDVTRAACSAARLLIGTSPSGNRRGPSCSMSILADAFKGSKAKEVTKRGYDKLDGFGESKNTNLKSTDVPRLLRSLVLQGFFFEESFRSDKGMFSTLTHSVHADQMKCNELFSGRSPVKLAFKLDDKTAAYRRGEQNERNHSAARREVPTTSVGLGGATNHVTRNDSGNRTQNTGPDSEPERDVFAPEDAQNDPVDEERYDFLFESLRDAREAMARKQGSKTGKTIHGFTIVPDRLLEGLARRPPPSYAALDKAQQDGKFTVLRENLFMRNHKEKVWKAIENGIAKYKGEQPPHEMFTPPAPTRPSQGQPGTQFEQFGYKGTPNKQNTAQWQRAGSQGRQGQQQQGQQQQQQQQQQRQF